MNNIPMVNVDPLTQAVQEQQTLIKGVRDYALSHYTRGWDVIIECYSDADIMEHIGNVRTVSGAIRKLSPMISAYHSHTKELEAMAKEGW